jgi:hypothetical protein
MEWLWVQATVTKKKKKNPKSLHWLTKSLVIYPCLLYFFSSSLLPLHLLYSGHTAFFFYSSEELHSFLPQGICISCSLCQECFYPKEVASFLIFRNQFQCYFLTDLPWLHQLSSSIIVLFGFSVLAGISTWQDSCLLIVCLLYEDVNSGRQATCMACSLLHPRT